RLVAHGGSAGLTPSRLVEPDCDLRVSDADDVAVRELPVLDRAAVDRSPVGRAQIRQQRLTAVESHVRVLPGDARVRESERGVLAAAEQIGAPLETEGAPGSVLEMERHRQ